MDFLLHSNWKFKLCWRKLSHDCFWVPYTDIGSCFQFICKLVVRAYPWVACSQKIYLDRFELGIYSWVIKKRGIYIHPVPVYAIRTYGRTNLMIFSIIIDASTYLIFILCYNPLIWFSEINILYCGMFK